MTAVLVGCNDKDRHDGDDEPDKTAAPDQIRTVLHREPQTVEHIDGARVEAPSVRVLYSAETSLTEIPRPEGLANAQLAGPVLRFDSFAGVIPDKKTTIDVPIGDEGEWAVLVASDLGLWVPLPSEPIKLAGGKRALRVMIDRQPTPYIFTAARTEKVDAGGATPTFDLLRLEQLRWTDKQAFHKELAQAISAMRGPAPAPAPARKARRALRVYAAGAIRFDAGAALAFNRPRRAPLRREDGQASHQLARAGSASPAPAPTALPQGDPWALLSASLLDLWSAGRQMPSGPGGGNMAMGRALYFRALRRLRVIPLSVRKENTRIYRIDTLDYWPKGLPVSIDLVDVLNTTLGSYAPWGLEWTVWMAGHGMLDELDLRVLRPYGELLWSDTSIVPRGKGDTFRVAGPWVAAMTAQVRDLDPEKTYRHAWVRLCSPRVLDKTWQDYLRDTARIGELGLRWGGAFYGLVTLATGGTGGLLNLVPLGFALVDTGLEELDDGQGTICVDLGYTSTLGTYAITGITAYKEQGKLLAVGKAGVMMKDIGVRLALLDFATKVTQYLCAREGYSKFMYNEGNKNPSGYAMGDWLAQHGRQHRETMPPIFVHSSAFGPLREGAVYQTGLGKGRAIGGADYPVEQLRPATWRVDYTKIYRKSLNEPADLPVSPKELGRFFLRTSDQGLRPLRLYHAPREQFVAYALPKEMLQAACQRKGIDPQEWWRVASSALDLTVKLYRGGRGGQKIPVPLADSDKAADGKARHFCLRMIGEEHDVGEGELVRKHVPSDFRAPSLASGRDYEPGTGAFRRLEGQLGVYYALEVLEPDGKSHRFKVDFRDRSASRRVAALRKGNAIPWHISRAVPRVLQQALFLGPWQYPTRDGPRDAPEVFPCNPLLRENLLATVLLQVDMEAPLGKAYFDALDRGGIKAAVPTLGQMMNTGSRNRFLTGPLQAYRGSVLLRFKCNGSLRYQYKKIADNRPNQIGRIAFFGLPTGGNRMDVSAATEDGQAFKAAVVLQVKHEVISRTSRIEIKDTNGNPVLDDEGKPTYRTKSVKVTLGVVRSNVAESIGRMKATWAQPSSISRHIVMKGDVGQIYNHVSNLQSMPGCTVDDVVSTLAVGAEALRGVLASGRVKHEQVNPYFSILRFAGQCAESGTEGAYNILKTLVEPVRREMGANGPLLAAQLHVCLADNALMRGRFETAIDHLEQALKIRVAADPKRWPEQKQRSWWPTREQLEKMQAAMK